MKNWMIPVRWTGFRERFSATMGSVWNSHTYTVWNAAVSLVRVLNEGHLAAACLDVTDPEPLPADHPLWKARNVFITPHVSAGDGTNVTVDNVSDIFYVNLRHYVNNEPLEHVVNKKQGY